jgi:inner membrane protein
MKDLLTPPVIWFLVGLVLLLLELVLPGLIIIFFGVGAWIVALCLLFFDLSLTAQFWIFGISSVLGLVLLRRFLKKKFFKEEETTEGSLEAEFIGKKAVTETDLVANKPGKVSFKGTQWTAIADCDIAKGEDVEITGKESITLKVTKLK